MNFKKFLLFTFLFIFTLSQACCEDNTIKVSGNAEIKVKPDIAIITVRVENTAKITAEALSAVNRKIASVIGILKANGVSDDDYSTSSFSINPQYEFINRERVLVGQKAQQTLSVTVRDLTRDGAAIGVLVDALSGVNGININGVSFEQSDKRLGVKQARLAAFESAKSKAKQYQTLTSQGLRRVLRIQDVSGGSYQPFFADAANFSSRTKIVVPVREVTVSASVNVIYSLSP